MAARPAPSPPPCRWRLRLARRVLAAGGILAYPTEGVYGLGCDPLRPKAVARLLALKGRSWKQGLILVAAGPEQLRPWVDPGDPRPWERALATWPGPVTWVLPAAAWVPPWIRGRHPTVAVRVTAHPLAAALCRAWGGPLVSTSANRHGRPPARTALQVRRSFPRDLDLILPGRTLGLGGPTEIRAADGRLLRRGAAPRAG